ncbi:MAG: L-2-amino-thiazoline-4-carboxylic acid hydrolase [Actinobacteria bacterium]|nr:L-2-amino-thiazoline-4-carboxylic acid hydrolase [Actinomycetota bacterium]
MTRFTDKDRAEYFHRSYKAVDGLWFVKTEEQFDFDTALSLDGKVWKVMPKIQARFLKKKLGLDKGLDSLCECFFRKLELDGFEFEVERSISAGDSNGYIKFIISKCPWHEIMIGSNRTHLSDKVGGVICKTEYGVWASEFGQDIKFKFGANRICRGDHCCILYFETGNDRSI